MAPWAALFPAAIAILFSLLFIVLVNLLGAVNIITPRHFASFLIVGSLFGLIAVGSSQQRNLELLMHFGFLRRHHTSALLRAGMIVVCGLALLEILPLTLVCQLNPLWCLQLLVWYWLVFLAGWLIALGQQYQVRLMPLPLVALVASGLLMLVVFLIVWLPGFLSPLDSPLEMLEFSESFAQGSTSSLMRDLTPSLIGTAIALVMGVVATIVGRFFANRAPIKT
jgi:hypothetical protein